MAHANYVRYAPKHLAKKKPNRALQASIAVLAAICVIAVLLVAFVFLTDRANALEGLKMQEPEQTQTITATNLSYSVPLSDVPIPTPSSMVREAANAVTVGVIETTRIEAKVTTYDPNQDYTVLMLECLEEAKNSSNPEIALAVAEIYEGQRNLKIRTENLVEYEETHNFSETSGYTLDDLVEIYYGPQEPEPYMSYTQEEAVALACIIYAESGSSFITDEHQRDVGSVVINRVADGRFGGNSIMGVIRAPGQYPTKNNTKYDERSMANALYVLNNGPTTTGLYQANFIQGTEVLKTYEYPYCNTTYICR